MNLSEFKVFLLLPLTQHALSMAEDDRCLLSPFLQSTSGAELCIWSSCLVPSLAGGRSGSHQVERKPGIS